ARLAPAVWRGDEQLPLPLPLQPAVLDVVPAAAYPWELASVACLTPTSSLGLQCRDSRSSDSSPATGTAPVRVPDQQHDVCRRLRRSSKERLGRCRGGSGRPTTSTASAG